MSILDNVKFKYGPGIQQNYKYIVDIRTLFNGTSKNESTVYVEGTVNLRFLTRCDAVLTLSDITLNEKSLSGLKNSAHPNSQQFADAVTENSLRFSFKDGLIAELCPSVDEPVWVLNFKRGILSLLHNSMKRFDLDHSGEEEDVQGKCFTEYKVLGANGTGLLVSKYKNLNLCQRRSKLHSILQTTTTGNFNRNKKNDNILKSSSHCHLVIDHNIYNEISCEETHVFQPFSNQNSGVTTVVQQKLSLISEDMIEVMAEEPEVSRRAILGFDNVLPSKVTHGELKSSRDLLKKLCRSQDVYHDGLSELFSKFIQSLRLISYPAMSALYGHSKTTCPMARYGFSMIFLVLAITVLKILLDVMPFINTAASVSIMRDIILKETVPENIASEWLFSIAFIASPDRDVVTAAASLLQENKFSQTITLSVASLVHTFCMVQDNCNNSEAVISVVNYLESRLLEALQIGNLDREKYDEIMVLLKALSNIGIISDNLQNELFKIIRDNNIDTALRIAAVETFRRFSCENTRNYFVEIFRNQEVDAEVRIASYIQIMRCPNYLLIRTIRHSLLHEEVNQVGSFIWTHLNNLLKTSVPTKVEIQSLLSEKDLVKKFSSDIRKYSHNFEGSLYFDDYNLGSSYDSNVIFSTSSYVPRSVMFNFTVDMFGESLNIFEINSRLEGFEHYLESLFGPKGSSNIMPNSIIKSIRQTRDIQSDEALKNEMDQLPNFFKNVTKDPKEISYKKSHVLLDCNYIVPTTAGVPILLTALGTSSVNVKLFGSLKTGGFSKNRELELDLTADIQPTVSLDISGEMSVDAFYASTGAKIKANIYTDTAIKTIVKVRDKKLVSIKFSLPRQKNEIFSVRWYINKSDPTANVYLFEYKRTQRKDLSVISLTFDTPGSEVKRVLNANLTVDKQSHNLTMLLQSPEGEMLARGKYKNTYDEKFIQIALDVNRKKHFDASFSLTKHDIKNGYTYRPIAYLVVNGERVMKLEGSIDSMSKRGISQYTVDLKFETKRLNSKLFGYISKSESSLEVNMYQDYKFQNAKEQRIVLKFGVANRSRNNMVIVVGFCNLTCTAYPYLNFVSNATFQRSGGHMDLAIKLNQSPTSQSSNLEKENLEFDLLFSYKAFTDNKRTLRLVAALNKESSDIHLKGEFTYEHFLYDINIAALVKYGDNKDVSVTMFWSHPRSTMEQIKTHINVTIPSFTPMIFNLDIEEKHPKYYQIDLKATWFSGHSITALGFYQDKSVASSLNHHIKLSLNSPSFQNINADLQFYRDNNVLKLDLKALHDNDDYQIFFHYQTVTLEETRMLINIKYKEKLYKFLNTIYDGPYKRIHAELHIDQ
ncbi:hypothetical protein NQ315_002765 [Exocentrus adspersus]|uniref:Vitellogenin domain-containing protein n=1 Tax=Exocentrus adspersus TaxID=1586481 RepID=A0AAV8VJT6_9CUCU|nr:hypothetical protein NQ315_002765 [Exocentrus adspersus]